MKDTLTPDVVQRLWKYVERGDGCWLWTGSLGSEGYGQLSVNHRPVNDAPLVGAAL